MTRTLLTAERAFRLFADALRAFSDDPGPENLERYLAASRRLEESRLAEAKSPRVRPRAVPRGADAA
jgi:hypothetical protein